MKVWVHSRFQVLAEALVLLVQSYGFEATATRHPDSDIALIDLSDTDAPYPPPPDLPALAIIPHGEFNAVALLQRRYRGYIKTTDTADTLRRALEAIRRGEPWADRILLAKTIDSFTLPALTRKEEQVYNLLSHGLSNRVIAEQLGIAEGTVKMHVSHLFDKLGVKSRGELMAHLLGSGGSGE